MMKLKALFALFALFPLALLDVLTPIRHTPSISPKLTATDQRYSNLASCKFARAVRTHLTGLHAFRAGTT